METKLCECNCGGVVTTRYKRTIEKLGYTKGELHRFIPGHVLRKHWDSHRQRIEEASIQDRKFVISVENLRC